MGLFKVDNEESSHNGRPWFLPSGTYEFRPVKVDIKDSKVGELSVYTISWVPELEPLKRLPSPPPSPLDLPTVEVELDANLDKELKVLYGILGEPFLPDGAREPVWGENGLVHWNGRTDDPKFQRTAELSIETREPNPRADGKGWWQAKYSVVDIARVGEAAQMAQAATAKLVARKSKVGTAPEAPKPPVKQQGRKRS